MKKKHKLKNMKLTSVDVCKQGVNPEAYIKLIKSAADGELQGENKTSDECGYYCYLLYESIMTLINDEHTEALENTVDEFADFLKAAARIWAKDESVEDYPDIDAMIRESDTGRLQRKEIEDMAKLSPQEETEYKRLQAKLAGDDTAEGTDKTEEETEKAFVPKGQETKSEHREQETDAKPGKSKDKKQTGEQNVSDEDKEKDLPEFAKAILKKSQAFIAKAELKEEVDAAKKYELLGQNAEELGKKLLELKRKDEEMYNSVIEMLDNQLGMIKKSGLFTEIGKSGVQGGIAGAVEKAEGMAAQIRKSSPGMTYEQAMAQVWDTHPELMAEYNG